MSRGTDDGQKTLRDDGDDYTVINPAELEDGDHLDSVEEDTHA